jgi:hypothetical protein
VLVSVQVLAIAALGCAGTPRWVTKGDASPYYFQGVGTGSTAAAAERDALLKLLANINGTAVESVIEDFRRESGNTSPGDQSGLVLQTEFREWISTRIAGKVPAEARVVARWRGQGTSWAYAVVERPGQEELINQRHRQAMAGVQRHAWVPGWAQFQKRQTSRAWTYTGGVAAGLLGGASLALLADDAGKRRDQARVQLVRDHYDRLANQRYWASQGLYALAVGIYVVNVLDGMTSKVQPYRILAGMAHDRATLVLSLRVP